MTMASETTSDNADLPQATQRARTPWRIPIAMLLGLSLGALVLLAAATILVISIWSGIQSTIDVLQDQAVFAIDTVTERLDDHLSPAEEQLNFINDLIVSGRLDPSDDRRMEDVLTGALAATPQVDGIVFLDNEGRMRGVVRSGGGGGYWFDEDQPPDTETNALTDNVAARESGRWGDLVWSPALDTAVQTIRRPVVVGGDEVGVLGAGVSVLSRHSPDDIQIRGNRTTAPSPRELCSHCSHPMT